MLVHVKLHKQQTYAQHFDKGYVIGMLFEHYQCQKVWMKDTLTTQVSGMVWFKHKYPTNPFIIQKDQIVAAIGRLATTLTTGVALQLCNNTVDKLCKLQQILEPRMDGNDECKITAPMQQAPIWQQSPRQGGKRQPVLGHQADLKESSKSKELAELRLQVLVAVKNK